jgi:hypothetical protein
MWKAESDAGLTASPFSEWVRGHAQRKALDVTNPDDMDRFLPCTKPSQRATRYGRMKAFGNHFRAENSVTMQMQTYDSGVASVFQVPGADTTEVSLNCIGVVKDILKLDYRPLHTLVILLQCSWLKRQDAQGNPTYSRDDARILVVNFRHKMPQMSDPFIFSSQATQIFFSDDRQKPG